MKYIITGIDNFRGNVNSDSNLLSEYFELGWEIMTTHLKVKEMLYDSQISDCDTIVTCEGREFLYKKTFKNVITWSKYKNSEKKNEEINLVNFFTENFSNLTELGNRRDVNLIDIFCSFEQDIKVLKKFNLSKKYVCIVYRERGHDVNRNVDKNYMINLINFLIENFDLNVFVVGFGGEFLCDNKKSFFVSLSEFTYLINKTNCCLCLSTLTGPPHLTYLFGHKKLKNIIIDLQKSREPENMKNHPLAMGDKFNFKKIETIFINGGIDLNSLITIIKNKMV